MMQSDSGGVVVLVEDNDDLRSMYHDWLTETYQVRVAEDGQTALEVFDTAVDVVLLDRKLPGTDGENLLPQFRERHPGCQIALVTSVAPEWATLEMDIDAYLTKPVRQVDLRVLVQGLIEQDYQAIANHENITL